MVCELFYWPLINFLTKALCGRNLSLMWTSIRVSRKAARTEPQQTKHNTIRPTVMENVMNHMEQQNMELTFTQMPQPMHSSSEMKAIFDCEETSIQSLPAPQTHTHTCSAVVQWIRYPDARVFAKTIFSRTERRWELRKDEEENGVVEEWGEGKHGPVFTTGQLFLHSWRHFLGLHLSELTIAILVNRSDIAPALSSSPPTSSNLLSNRPKSKIPHNALPRSKQRLYLFFDSYFWRTLLSR
jgi:hypothetical protein